MIIFFTQPDVKSVRSFSKKYFIVEIQLKLNSCMFHGRPLNPYYWITALKSSGLQRNQNHRLQKLCCLYETLTELNLSFATS